MRFDDGPGDGQPQARAAYPTIARLIGAVEAVENVGKICGVDADPVIDY